MEVAHQLVMVVLVHQAKPACIILVGENIQVVLLNAMVVPRALVPRLVLAVMILMDLILVLLHIIGATEQAHVPRR
jgi:hypothetical protein